MRPAARARAAAAPLRWFWRSPLAIAALVTGVTCVVVVERAVAAMGAARELHLEMERMAARVVAESAAHEFVSTNGATRNQVVDVGGGIRVQTFVEPQRDGGSLRLTARVGEQRLDFAFPQLAGGTSPVFGRALTVAKGASMPVQWSAADVVEPADLPQLVVAPAQGAAPLPALLTADAGIALLRLAAGTDRDDFVLGSNVTAAKVAARGTVAVRGNLWVDCGAEPLELELADDLTLVVQGNVYLGRGVRVRGPGQLTIVAVTAPGGAFADLDGNGRWSPGDELRGSDRFAGPMEGTGNVWLGLPRDGQGRLEFDLGLVAGGVLHVAVDAAQVHGPVVLHQGGVPMAGRDGMLVATGRRLPSLRRAALPGFLTVGSPRPGMLQPLAGETLYPAGPAR